MMHQRTINLYDLSQSTALEKKLSSDNIMRRKIILKIPPAFLN